VFPENIHTPSKETSLVTGNSKEEGVLKANMSLNLNFQRGGGLKPKKPYVGGGEYGYFLEQHNTCN